MDLKIIEAFVDTAHRPYDHITVPGKLNTVFIVAVAFGMFLIIVAMILHIINAAKSKDVEEPGLMQMVWQGLVSISQWLSPSFFS